jgi:hypothetical protein
LNDIDDNEPAGQHFHAGNVRLRGTDLKFLKKFGGPANPMAPVAGTMVIETYPVLAMIALGWTLLDMSPHPRPTGRCLAFTGLVGVTATGSGAAGSCVGTGTTTTALPHVVISAVTARMPWQALRLDFGSENS